MHWDWDWDWDWEWGWHHDHYWPWFSTWPWESFFHLKCPIRTRFWSSFSDFDVDVCSREWHVHCADPAWCHRSCLTGRVYIESGDEADSCGKGTFKVVIDVHHFRADELVLKVRNNDTLIVEGKHKDDRADKASAICITSHFTRKYRVPRNYDATQARATLSKDGILTVIVPAPPSLDDVERVVDIEQTEAYYGSPSRVKADSKAIEEDKTGARKKDKKYF